VGGSDSSEQAVERPELHTTSDSSGHMDS